MDRIFIDNLRVKCRIGVTDDERREAQDVIIDISLYKSLNPAGVSESVEESIDYKEVHDRVSDFVSAGEFRLLEGLAERIASISLNWYKVDSVSVRVRKSKYSSEPSIGVEIERSIPTRGM